MALQQPTSPDLVWLFTSGRELHCKGTSPPTTKEPEMTCLSRNISEQRMSATRSEGTKNSYLQKE